ncbi:MAG TPA: hypothetical protein VMV72_19145 [Verrucomicrobiae bacterium]|nr:hypothetical protein [Verrucomicrobiae bacterium]
MNQRSITLIFGITAVASAASFGQVIIRGTEVSDPSAGNSSSSSAVTINTGDRNIVPLIKEDKTTKLNATTEESQSVTKAPGANGGYYDWRTSTTVTKEVAPGQSDSSSTVVEKDRQGQSRVIQQTDTTVIKSAAGEAEQAKVYRRNSSGELVLDHVADVDTVKRGAGVAETTSAQQTVDVNGNLIAVQQVDSTTVSHGPNEQVTTADTRSVNHMNGQTAVTAQETTSVATQGNTKQSDSVVSTPGQFGWAATSRTTTTETKAPDGSVVRETTVSSLPAYSTKTGNESTAPLTPQTKIVEHEVRKPDGTVVQQRDVFHRDVNGEWVPETFSTKQADKGLNN